MSVNQPIMLSRMSSATPYKKIIAVDMDGTLLANNLRLLPLSEEIMSRLSDEGYLVVLASGRPWRSIKPYYERCHCSGPVIAYNGAYTFHPGDPNFPKLDFSFDKEAIKDIYRKSKSYVTSFMCETNTDVYVTRRDDYLAHYFWYDEMKFHVGDIEPLIKENLYTCIFRCTHAHDDELKKLCESYPGIVWRHWTGSFYSELARVGANKGAGLAHIMKQYGIGKEDVIAFGDSNNDAEMLEEAGYPFVPCDSKSDYMKSRFPLTKKGSSNNGVANELIELLGIKL